MEDGNTAPLRPDEWLIGALGVWMGTPATGWRRLGPFTYVVNDMVFDTTFSTVPDVTRLLVAGGHGLWETSGDPADRWVQLHDETLTEVMAVRSTAEGVIAAGSYGIARATQDEIGVPRWHSQTETRVPDERFTNTLQVTPEGLQLAGTEAGVLVSEDGGNHWQLTDLTDTAVRALHRMSDHWLAGTDARGLWRSEDGLHWTSLATPTTAVFSIAATDQHLILGGYDGLHVQDEAGWRHVGPRALMRTVAVGGNLWLAGADPGGLWISEDEGASWHRSGSFHSVRSILPAGRD